MKRILLSLFLSLLTAAGSDAGTITVAGQADFDGLDVRLRKQIQSGDRDIRVRFQPGTYFFKVRALTQNNKSKNAYSAYSNALKVKLAKAK